MNKYLWATLAAASLAAGCNSNDKSASARPPLNPAITDISPNPPSHYSPQAQPIQPIAMAPVEQPAAPAAFTSTGGGTYTVQKGDTLYKIARERYGDGKQWQKIAAANPGLTPQSLKVGQKISVPQ